MIRKKAKVHMLPTEGLSSITKGKGEYSHSFYFNPEDEYVEDEDEYPIHLYFTNDEEIKEGDKMLTHEGVETAEYDGYSFDNGDEFCLKITFSTDPKLNSNQIEPYDTSKPYGIEFPQPSQDFIKAYCEQGGIDKVDVEYKEVCIDDKCEGSGKCGPCLITKQTLKLNPDNTVITHLIEEKMIPLFKVKELIEKHSDFIDSQIDYDGIASACCSIGMPEWDDEKWIKENL